LTARRNALDRPPIRGRLAWLIVALASSAGCNESPYALAPVSGTVTIDGQPLTAGRVMFAPIATGDGRDAGKPASGRLQPGGRFVLTTFDEGDGAVVGDHWITVIGPAKDEVTPTGGASQRIADFGRFTVPMKQTVVAGQQNQLDIRVTSQDVARFSAQ
jgi:hypothetical protein